MENQKYAKLTKILLWVLMILSICVLVWGWFTGFEAKDGAATNVLLYWAYIVLGIALFAVICVGLYITATTNPKGLVKIGIAVVAAAVLFGICYLLASGAPALNCSKPTTPGELKLTDTILNLTYITGCASILAVVFSVVWNRVRK